ncbi:hypothetical protein [Micromonospora sp. NPDC050276]|uniref:hypothetical protein n=1 Tax=Micromonospora sp. NPDC050276 TaxID=3364278 RepID=UPI00378812D5
MAAADFELGLNSFGEVATDGDRVLSDAETVRQKITKVARDLRLSRFDLKYDIMHLPRDARARTIELLGSEVAPRVRELLAKEHTNV